MTLFHELAIGEEKDKVGKRESGRRRERMMTTDRGNRSAHPFIHEFTHIYIPATKFLSVIP